MESEDSHSGRVNEPPPAGPSWPDQQHPGHPPTGRWAPDGRPSQGRASVPPPAPYRPGRRPPAGRTTPVRRRFRLGYRPLRRRSGRSADGPAQAGPLSRDRRLRARPGSLRRTRTGPPVRSRRTASRGDPRPAGRSYRPAPTSRPAAADAAREHGGPGRAAGGATTPTAGSGHAAGPPPAHGSWSGSLPCSRWPSPQPGWSSSGPVRWPAGWARPSRRPGASAEPPEPPPTPVLAAAGSDRSAPPPPTACGPRSTHWSGPTRWAPRCNVSVLDVATRRAALRSGSGRP